MKNLNIHWQFALPVMVLLLSACSLPGMTPQTTAVSDGPNTAYTAAAETIIAQLTQVSIQLTPSPAANLTAQPALPEAPTHTAELPSPTPTATETLKAPETPTPEATPTITPTEPPTPTLVEGDSKAGLGEPSWRETFSDGANWYLYSDEFASFDIRNNNLLMRVNDTGSRNAWMLTWQRPEDFYLEMTAQPRGCSGMDRYGLILRSDASDGYWFLFSCDGQYAFLRWDSENNRINRLVDWTPSEHILKGPRQVNRLGVEINDTHFTLFANGQELTDLYDATYTEGGFGVMIGADKTKNFRVEVSEVAYWNLP